MNLNFFLWRGTLLFQFASFAFHSKVCFYSMRVSNPPARSHSYKEFEEWSQKVEIFASKLEHKTFVIDSERLRGVSAMEATEGNAPLVVLPSKACIRVRAQENSPFPEWVSNETWSKQPWYAQLALKILWEKRQGDLSYVSGYIDFLPPIGTFDTLIHWELEELELLSNPSLIESVTAQKRAWHTLYTDLNRMTMEDVVTYEEFEWSMECVLSRAFSGNFGANLLTVAVTSILTISCTAYSVVTTEPWGFIAAILSLIPLTVKEFDGTSKEFPKSDHIMLPFVDSMNHDSSVKTDISFNPLSRNFSLKVSKEYKQGDQVFISYGERSNDELLQFYGFVEEENPFDEYIIFCRNGAKVTLGRGGKVIAPSNVDETKLKQACSDALEKLKEKSNGKEGTDTNPREHLASRYRNEKMRLLIEFLQ